MRKVTEVLKEIAAILAAIILILGQLSEIGEAMKSLTEVFGGKSSEDMED